MHLVFKIHYYFAVENDTFLKDMLNKKIQF